MATVRGTLEKVFSLRRLLSALTYDVRSMSLVTKDRRIKLKEIPNKGTEISLNLDDDVTDSENDAQQVAQLVYSGMFRALKIADNRISIEAGKFVHALSFAKFDTANLTVTAAGSIYLKVEWEATAGATGEHTYVPSLVEGVDLCSIPGIVYIELCSYTLKPPAVDDEGEEVEDAPVVIDSVLQIQQGVARAPSGLT